MEEKYQKGHSPTVLLCESHGEHHLPDYAGDMKKILLSSARILPAGKFIGAEEVQFGGSVVYDLWYLDAENRCTHESFSTDYEFTCPKEGEDTDGAITACITQFSLRPSGPRRIVAKATLEGRAILCSTASYSCTCEAEDAILHTRAAEVAVGQHSFSAPYEREYAESILLPVPCEDAEILFSEGRVQIESAEAEDEAVLARGEAVISAVLSADGLAPTRVCTRIPIEERIPLPGCTKDMLCTATGVITSLGCNLRAEDGGSIAVNVICELTASAAKSVPLSVVEDAYLEGGGETVARETLRFETIGAMRNELQTQELRLPMEEDGESVDSVFHTAVALKDSSFTASGACVTFTAEADICALGVRTDEDGEQHYAVRRARVPLALQLSLPAPLRENEEVALDCAVGLCEGRMDDETLCVSVPLLFSLQTVLTNEKSCVCRIQPPKDGRGVFVPTYTVYYPAKGECLWSIAKRFGVSVAALASCNGVSDSSSGLSDTLPQRLLINRRML